MTHPRLSVSAMCTYSSSFAEDLALWSDLELSYVGLLISKLDDYGHDASIAALHEHSMQATTIITQNFNLAAPDTWDATRAQINTTIDLAAAVGGVPYITPGRRDGRSFDELTAALGQAVAPCLAYADTHGVRLAIEPSLRTDQSFVHTLRDAIDIADRTGISLVADLGNCWAERDVEDTIRRAGSRIAAVQFADAQYGVAGQPVPVGRFVPGDGDLPIEEFIEATLDAGYNGAFELELVGPAISEEGGEAAVRRAAERASLILEKVLS
jgi:sugar phosphate isomerase/epimerase